MPCSAKYYICHYAPHMKAVDQYITKMSLIGSYIYVSDLNYLVADNDYPQTYWLEVE